MIGHLAASVALTGVLVPMIAAGAGALCLNLSASMPAGLYRVRTGATPTRGMTAVVCLPAELGRLGMARGYLQGGRCLGSVEPVLKPVAAVAGDTVDVTAAGVSVNGVVIVPPGLALDRAGRPASPMRPGHYIVPAGAVWLLSAHSARSWDSRYYGPVPVAGVRGRAWPLLVLR